MKEKKRALTRSRISPRLELGLPQLGETHICCLNHWVYGALWWRCLGQYLTRLPSIPNPRPRPPPKLIKSLTSRSPKPWIWESPKSASLSPDLLHLAEDVHFSLFLVSLCCSRLALYFAVKDCELEPLGRLLMARSSSLLC